MRNDCYIYAEGVNRLGFGHLYRAKRLIQNVFSDFQFTFVICTDMEEAFCERYELRSLRLEKLEGIHPRLLIIDSKRELNSGLVSLKNRSEKSIAIDTTSSWAESVDCVIFPSFYFNKDRIRHYLKNVPLYGGKGFVSLAPSSTSNKSRDILVTFGGSDPNNITGHVLNAFSVESILSRTTTLIGPGYRQREDLILNYPAVEFIEFADTTTEYVGSASLVITAVGTTLQEIEFYQKPAFLICNYESDHLDFLDIVNASSVPSTWRFGGTFDGFCADSLVQYANESVKTDLKIEHCARAEWGRDWSGLLCELGVVQ